ncbi:hypothetical protein U9M48_018378 [Paspalum notatum var. saurae]|uniref:F-box domain-containing protein n=1 Tax=Paspalum notatum var. saurae TaxID=547442 RepID=A0AAQ3WPM6_PASNO
MALLFRRLNLTPMDQQLLARYGLSSSQDTRKGASSKQDDGFDETKAYSWPYLPEEIWHHIHSFMPLRDAARAACVCRAFLRSWRSFPNLTFSNQTLGLNELARGKDEIASDFTSKVDHVMMNHLGPGMKTLKLLGAPSYDSKHRHYLDRWLEKAITQGIEELTLHLANPFIVKRYKLPCSILLRGNGETIRSLSLRECAFRPTVGLSGLRSLVRLDLSSVRIKGDELGCLLSSTVALESLELSYCREIVYVKIPCLQRLTFLFVSNCGKLKVIESKAPNLSRFQFTSSHHVHLSLGKALQVKKLYIDCSQPFCHSRAELASSVPSNLEAVGIHPSIEMCATSSVSSKYLYLEHLSITLRRSTFSQDFDYFSMVSYPSLEDFVLDVSRQLLEHPSYDAIRSFSLARTWVYQTRHILKAWLS